MVEMIFSPTIGEDVSVGWSVRPSVLPSVSLCVTSFFFGLLGRVYGCVAVKTDGEYSSYPCLVEGQKMGVIRQFSHPVGMRRRSRRLDEGRRPNRSGGGRRVFSGIFVVIVVGRP